MREEYIDANCSFIFSEIVLLVAAIPEGMAVIDGFRNNLPDYARIKDGRTMAGYYIVTQEEALMLILADDIDRFNVFMMSDDNPMYVRIKEWIKDHPVEAKFPSFV